MAARLRLVLLDRTAGRDSPLPVELLLCVYNAGIRLIRQELDAG